MVNPWEVFVMTNREDRREIEVIETKFLGTLFMNPSLFYDTINILEEKHFSLEDHQRIFEAMVEVHDSHRKIGIDSVTEAIDNKYANRTLTDLVQSISLDALELTQLNGVYDDTEFFEHADVIKERWRKREMIKYFRESHQKLLEGGNHRDEIAHILELAEKLEDERPSTSVRLYDQVLLELENWRKIQDGEIKPLALIKTCWPTLNDALGGGLMRASMITISGRPSHGKTMAATQMLTQMAKEGEKVLLITLEAPRSMIANRMISNMGQVTQSQLEVGDVEEEQWERLQIQLAELHDIADNIIIDDNCKSAESVFSSINRHIRQQGTTIVCVDYIQNVDVSRANSVEHHQKVASFVKRLERLAVEKNIIIIAISQLSREFERKTTRWLESSSRKGSCPRPTMSDHSDTKKLDESSAQMICLFREEVYVPDTPNKGAVEFIIMKNRNGKTGTATLQFDGDHLTIREYRV